MHEAALAQAALPEQVSILNLRMRPYSLGHELVLTRSENPFVVFGGEGTSNLADDELITALIQAADVCSQTWNQNRWSPVSRKELRLFGLVTKRWHAGLRSMDWPAEAAKFKLYREQAFAQFKSELPAGSGGSVRFLGSPELLQLYLFVAKEIPDCDVAQWSIPTSISKQPTRFMDILRLLVFRFAGVSAWDYPMGLARMQKQAFDELEGRLEIYNYRQLRHDQAVAALREKMAAIAAEHKEKEQPNA